MPKIVFATCLLNPEILNSDQYLYDALTTRGAEVEAAPWNGPFQPFLDADHVIIRSTWDYFDVVDQYYAWFDLLDSHRVGVSNSLETLRWNAKKHYLFELIQKQAKVIPTISVGADVEDIAKIMRDFQWSKAVLKCLVSGSSQGLSLLTSSQPQEIEQALDKAEPLSQNGLMLQPFFPQIKQNGELSLVFIDGEFSHAVKKTPRQDEFRVQSEFGGQYSAFEASANLIAECKSYLDYVPGDKPLYARVDGLIIDEQFLLMELELTEPELMFQLAPQGAHIMASAVMNRLQS